MTRIQAMIPAIEATTARLLDAVAGQDEFDLVAALAFPLPANIVFSLMGVPEEDYPQLKLWCGSRAALGWGRPAPGDQVEIATSMAAYRRYLRDLVDLRAGQPGDDLTSDLLAIHREDTGRLTREEIASILFSLSFAGHETTTGLIGNTMRRLLEDPARWARVAGQPDLIPTAVEETLRYDPSVPVWRRVTTRPVTIGGVDLPEGAKLFLWLAAGAGSSPSTPTSPSAAPRCCACRPEGMPGRGWQRAGRQRRRRAAMIQVRESKSTPSPVWWAAKVARSRSSAFSACPASMPASRSLVLRRPLTTSRATAASGP
jgi:hypothetical protein